MIEEDDILDDVNSILLIPEEEIIWEDKPHNEDAWLIFIAVLLGFVVLYKLIRFLLDGSFSFDFLSVLEFILDNSIHIIFVLWFTLFPYYIRNNEKYWLLKDRIAIRKGFKRKIRVFNFSDIETIQHGIFEDASANQKNYIVIKLVKKVNDPFSIFNHRKDKFSIGPFQNSQEVYDIFKREFEK